MTDDGLSPQVQAWLASAGSRPNEPGRQDRPEDVRARLDQHPQVGPPWGLTDDEAKRLMDAIGSRHHYVPAGWLLRPGGSWSAKPDGILCTVVAYDPAEEPDSLGRRPSDLDAGQLLAELAGPVCDAYNARQAETPST